MSRTIAPILKIAWDGTNFVDETANLISATGSMKMTAPGSSIVSPQGTVDRMSLTLYNRSETGKGRRYSPLNTSGNLYNYIKDGGAYHRPVTFDVSINGSLFNTRVFTGVIKIPQEGTPTPRQEATVTIECRSVDELLLQQKLSTSGASINSYANSPVTEAQLITDLLTHPDVDWNPSEFSISSGFFTIPHFWLDDESVLEEIWSLAAACGGRFYARKDGVLVYENLQSWVKSAKVGKWQTYTRADYGDLRVRYTDDDLYNIVTVEASPRRLGDTSILWEPDEQISVPAGSTKKVTAKMRQPAYFVNSVSYQATSSSGTDMTASVSVSSAIFAQRVELTFTNAHATLSANIQTLQIKGIPIVGAPTIEEKVESTHAFWTNRDDRTRSVRGNNYIQGRAQANSLASFLKDTSERPRLSYTITNALGNPERQLGQLIEINDTSIMSSVASAFITGINWSYTQSGGFLQTIEAVDLSFILAYSISDYFVIGTDVPGNGTSTGKRVYY